MKIFFINPANKSPFSHLNIHLGLRLAFSRHPKIEFKCMDVEEAIVTTNKPDYYFFLDHEHFHDHYKTLKRRAKVAIWLLEDPYEIDLSEYICQSVDVAFSMDMSGVELRRKNSDNIHLLPLGFNRDVFNIKEPYQPHMTDILLVGVAFPKRVKVAKSLAIYCHENGLKLKIIGLWWDREKSNKVLMQYVDNRIISELELASYYANTKIAIEINRDLNTHNDRRIPGSTPGRGFGSCACNTFTLTNMRKTLSNFFNIGKEIEVARTPDEVINKVQIYLGNEAKRKEVALNGYRRVLTEHTLDHRVATLFKILGKYRS